MWKKNENENNNNVKMKIIMKNNEIMIINDNKMIIMKWINNEIIIMNK